MPRASAARSAVELLGKDGRAQVALWLVDYKDTVVNPYKELIIVFSTVPASKSVAPISFAHSVLL